ncbi:MAG: hypothetical protein SA339_08440 [Methanomassiliicoccus sp.]|nr:hypothetical protein [Methanomassiliicoccus sp.]
MISPFVRADILYQEYLEKRHYLTLLDSQEEKNEKGSFPTHFYERSGGTFGKMAIQIGNTYTRCLYVLCCVVVCLSLKEDPVEIGTEDKSSLRIASMYFRYFDGPFFVSVISP